LRERTRVLEEEITALRDEARGCTNRPSNVERAKGEDWRQNVQPLRQRLFDLKEEPHNEFLPTQAKCYRKKSARLWRSLRPAKNRKLRNCTERIAWCIKERAHFDEEIGTTRNRATELRTQAR
jgi:uncharacterized coiled-coil DUF342 family protein